MFRGKRITLGSSLFGFLVIFGILLYRLLPSTNLLWHGVTTRGVIVAEQGITCRRLGRSQTEKQSLSFSVQFTDQAGQTQVGTISQCDYDLNASSGDSVAIVYLPNDPTEIAPPDRLIDYVQSTLIETILCGLITLILLPLWIRKRMRKTALQAQQEQTDFSADPFQRPRSRGLVPVGKRLPLILFAVLLVLTIPVGIIVSLANTSHGMSTVHTTSAPTKPPVSSTTVAEPTATSTTVAEPTATLTPPSLPISMDTLSINDPNSGVHWGRNQEWIFDPIYIPKTGSYHLTLKYEHDTNTTCDITVDGGEKQKVNLSAAVPVGNDYPGNVTIIVKLNKGNNDITVYPPPDLLVWNEAWLRSITISQ